MRTFIQFVTEFRGLKADEADEKYKDSVVALLQKGETPPVYKGIPHARAGFLAMNSAGQMKKEDERRNSVSATLNQGVAGGGY